MGCDIRTFTEQKNSEGVWEELDLSPFDWRSYRMFGFLAGVRNYSCVGPLVEPRGFPPDASPTVQKIYEDWSYDAHTPSWLTVEELSEFNYDAPCEDRRTMIKTGPHSWNGAHTCEPGEGKKTTFREFLGEAFFDDLQKLKESNAGRIVFWFDN
jgi:hypothetical protein